MAIIFISIFNFFIREEFVLGTDYMFIVAYGFFLVNLGFNQILNFDIPCKQTFC